MGKTKKKSADAYLIDLYQMRIRVWPLFGLNRLVKLSHRKRNGVLYCDNAMCSSEAIAFSEKNARTERFTMSHTSPNHAGVHAEPRINFPNEASEADRQRFIDDGTGVVFSFTPQSGKTFSMESTMYKTYDAGHRYTRGVLPDDTRIARWEMTLDVSAYLQCGFSDTGEPPRCEPGELWGRKTNADAWFAPPPAVWSPRRKVPGCGSGTLTMSTPAASIAWPGNSSIGSNRGRRNW